MSRAAGTSPGWYYYWDACTKH